MNNGPLRVGIGGPVGSGKTTLTEKLCKAMRDRFSIAVVTNDIYTKEDAMMLARLQALPEDRIMGVETGGCPHTAIREDASINLAAIADMNRKFPDLDIVFIESGGDNLAATFSPDLADLTLYVISVCQGEEIPRKGGPGITRSDFLVINKSDLAPYVHVDLEVMERDAGKMRGGRPFGFTDLSRGKGLAEIVDFIVDQGGLTVGQFSKPPDSAVFAVAARREPVHFRLEQEWERPMSVTSLQRDSRTNLPFYEERVDLAAAFRWTARLNMHEAVANHFSLAVNEDGTQFLMNPNQAHFARIKASDLLLIDANDPETLSGPNAPDPTAWGLHGAVHRNVLHARCVMHVHSIHSTVLASLVDSRLPPIDQNCATFFNRQVVDESYGGLAFEEEGERCSQLLSDPKVKVMIMGNHGILVIGDSVADAFNRMYYFERAAETYIKALWTGRPLRVLSDEIAEKTAREMDDYPDQAARHLSELKAILDEQEPVYRA